MADHEIKLFESMNVRSHWDAAKEKWHFSVVDVVQVLTGSSRPRKYWSDLKVKLQKEGSQLSEEIGQLKMRSPDGKFRATDAADVQALLRLIQSIPSSKAEPFKQWLAKVGYERMQEIADPAQSLDRSRENWQKNGVPTFAGTPFLFEMTQNQFLCSSAFNSPQLLLRGIACSAPDCESRRNRMPFWPESSLAFIRLPSGICTRLPPVM